MGSSTLLINAIDRQRGELRSAIIQNNQLNDLFIENDTAQYNKGNIYLGMISSTVPSLEAYFVSFGSSKHGFLPYKDAHKSGQTKFKVGDQLLVQVEKEERGTKGAALTNNISLAGQFLVLLPTTPSAVGISKNIEGTKRHETKKKLDDIGCPEGMGLILRTAAQNRDIEDLKLDLQGLLLQWQKISVATESATAPALIYQECSGIYKIIRDSLKDNIDTIIVDDAAAHDEIKAYIEAIKPSLTENIQLHTSQVPLFTHHQIEDQIESLYSRDVQLKSGGRLVIDRTEALYAIDVNSAQATSASNIEKTAYATNLEAVKHIAKLLRLRDINGIIIIDLIDMSLDDHKKKIMAEFSLHLKADSAKLQVSEISKLGLIEVSRQRTRPSLAERHLVTCPQCAARGFIRSIPSFSYSLLHIIEQHAIHGKTSHLLVQVPVDTATYLCNEKREMIAAIEQRQGVSISIISNIHFDIPKYQIKRIRSTDAGSNEPTYTHIQEPTEDLSQHTYELINTKQKEKPFVSYISPAVRNNPSKKKHGLIGRIIQAIMGEDEKKPIAAKKPVRKQNRQSISKKPTRASPATRDRGNQKGQQQHRSRGVRRNYRPKDGTAQQAHASKNSRRGPNDNAKKSETKAQLNNENQSDRPSTRETPIKSTSQHKEIKKETPIKSTSQHKEIKKETPIKSTSQHKEIKANPATTSNPALKRTPTKKTPPPTPNTANKTSKTNTGPNTEIANKVHKENQKPMITEKDAQPKKPVESNTEKDKQ